MEKKFELKKKRKNSRSCTSQPYFKSFWSTINIKCVTLCLAFGGSCVEARKYNYEDNKEVKEIHRYKLKLL